MQLAHRPAAMAAHLPQAAPGQATARAGAAATLNSSLTSDEVLAALTLLKGEPSPGASGLPAELFRCASRQKEPRACLLLPALTATLNRWYHARRRAHCRQPQPGGAIQR